MSNLVTHTLSQASNLEILYCDVFARVGTESANVDNSLIALPDPTQSVFEVLVTEVVECGHFFTQAINHVNINHMRYLNMLLNPATKLPVCSFIFFIA